MSLATSITFNNNFTSFIDQFERDTNLKYETATIPIYIEYVKAIFSDRQYQIGLSLHNDLQNILAVLLKK